MRRKATGQFELPVTAAEAIGYFTPEGERVWAPGWDPVYPTGEPTESPGTVFITAHGDVTTVWVIEKIDRGAHTCAYTRFTAGHHAGAVRVGCHDHANDRCVVTVQYDMTALGADHRQVLDAYDDDAFSGMMTDWAMRIAAAVDPQTRT